MAVEFSVRVESVDGLVAALDRMAPRSNRRWVVEALQESANRVQEYARTRHIIRGGRIAVAGPRGGRVLTNAPVNSRRLTSRSGRLRDSIRIDRGPLPRGIRIGSDVAYAAVHESGGSVSQSVRSHTRTSAFGRPTKPYTVRAFRRRMRFKARPFLGPAVDDASKEMPAIFLREWERAV